MAEQIASQQQADTTTSTTTTVTIDATDSPQQDIPTVCLTLRKPRCDRKVQWTTETVDNEDMDKKKSKCCCIYKKPRSFGESSSSESSDDEDPCHGHVEKKKKKKKSECTLHSESHSDDKPPSIETIPATNSPENLGSNSLDDDQQNPISAGPS